MNNSMNTSHSTHIPGFKQHHMWDTRDTSHKHRHDHQDLPQDNPVLNGAADPGGNRGSTLAPRLGRLNPYELLQMMQNKPHREPSTSLPEVIAVQHTDNSVSFIAGLPPAEQPRVNTNRNKPNSPRNYENRPNREKHNRGSHGGSPAIYIDSIHHPTIEQHTTRHPSRNTPRSTPASPRGNTPSVLIDSSSRAPSTSRKQPRGSHGGNINNQNLYDFSREGHDSTLGSESSRESSRATNNYRAPSSNRDPHTNPVDIRRSRTHKGPLSTDTIDEDDDWEGSAVPADSFADRSPVKSEGSSSHNDNNQWFHYETDDVIIDTPAIDQGDVIVSAVDGDIKVSRTFPRLGNIKHGEGQRHEYVKSSERESIFFKHRK